VTEEPGFLPDTAA